MKFEKDIKLETKRLILRFLKREDSKSIFENITSDPKVISYYIAPFHTVQNDDWFYGIIEKYLNKEMYALAIVLKESNEVIGLINETERTENATEIGFAIGQNYWNHGYVTEAVKKVCEYFFYLGFKQIYCSHIKENIQSKRVIEKSGFVFDHLSEKELHYQDHDYDVVYYHLDESSAKE